MVESDGRVVAGLRPAETGHSPVTTWSFTTPLKHRAVAR
jgi:hypothetical protein